MIETVVFDVGGVLCASPPGEFAQVDEEYGLRPSTLEGFIRGGDLWARVETGRMPLTEFFGQAIATIEADQGVTVAEERLEQMLHRCMGGAVREDMVALVHDLKAAGHRTAIMSNIFAEKREWLRSFCGEGAVDVFCDSSEVGIRKPDQAIYDRLIELLGGVDPRTVGFVDDFAENLEPAAAMGMTVVLYESPAQVRSELAAAGARIALGDAA